jgi:hypothetical protein
MPIDTNVLESVRPSRRSVVRGAAWSVPVISVAATAPAFAASCQSTVVSTMNLTTRMGSNGNTLTLTNVFAGGMTAGTWNLRTDDTTQMPSGWLEFENRPRASGGNANPSIYQDITLQFSAPVSELTFDLADLDTSGSTDRRNNTTYNYWDAIAIHGTNVAYSATGVGSSLTGLGTLANPWRQKNFADNPPANNDAASNRLTVTFGGTVQTFKFRYWSIQGRSDYTGTQAVWMGNMKYKASCT